MKRLASDAEGASIVADALNSLITSEGPGALAKACFIGIPKKDGSYRPIAIHNPLARLFERVLYQRWSK